MSAATTQPRLVIVPVYWREAKAFIEDIADRIQASMRQPKLLYAP